MRSSLTISSRSIFATSSRIASAPMPAVKTLPQCSCRSRYSLSVSSRARRSSLSSSKLVVELARDLRLLCFNRHRAALRWPARPRAASGRAGRRSRRAMLSCSRLLSSSISLRRLRMASSSAIAWSRVTRLALRHQHVRLRRPGQAHRLGSASCHASCSSVAAAAARQLIDLVRSLSASRSASAASSVCSWRSSSPACASRVGFELAEFRLDLALQPGDLHVQHRVSRRVMVRLRASSSTFVMTYWAK